jgi:phosphopantetheine adenylyltransferase
MTEDPKKALDRLKTKLGHEKFTELAALIVERKAEGRIPLVVDEVRAEHGTKVDSEDLDALLSLMEDPKKAVDRVKNKLGPKKFSELAALIVERKAEKKSPHLVVDEIRDRYGMELEIQDLETFVIFIKY